jgi:hypothetical protein
VTVVASTSIELCRSLKRVEKVKMVIQTVFQRAESRVNSFAYFVKEITAVNDSRTLGVRRKALATIIRRVRENHGTVELRHCGSGL